ncbi:hypothetical protein FACS1894188_13140 [Clostridia bacterium]|nr:hypothetical protein FACS1894188_13140 [Clostridia bacterium]
MPVITVGDINKNIDKNIDKNEIKKAAEEIRQKRWKSPMLWGTGIVLLLFAIKTCFGIEFGDADTIVNLLLTILAALGIINDPTNAEKF